ncbi:MAG: hypothetical protein C0606_10265 [Hyphomicrobiales bacterium]|nr:MAG: hypothetical protein C0606_10265 [Hyphomicrobiales bacterium]
MTGCGVRGHGTTRDRQWRFRHAIATGAFLLFSTVLTPASPGFAQSGAAQESWQVHRLGPFQFQAPGSWVAGTAPGEILVGDEGDDGSSLFLSTGSQEDVSDTIDGLVGTSRTRISGVPATRYDWQSSGLRGVTVVTEARVGRPPLTVVFSTPEEFWDDSRAVFDRAIRNVRFAPRPKKAAEAQSTPREADAAQQGSGGSDVKLPAAIRAAIEARSRAGDEPEAAPAVEKQAEPAGDVPAFQPVAPAVAATEPEAPAEPAAEPDASEQAAPQKAVETVAEVPAAVEPKPATPAVAPTVPAPPAEKMAQAELALRSTTPAVVPDAEPKTEAVAADAPVEVARVEPAETAPAAASTPPPAAEIRMIADLGFGLRIPQGWVLDESTDTKVVSWRLRHRDGRSGMTGAGAYALTLTLTDDSGKIPFDTLFADTAGYLAGTLMSGGKISSERQAVLGPMTGRVADLVGTAVDGGESARARVFIARKDGRLLVLSAVGGKGAALDQAFGAGGLVTTGLRPVEAASATAAE